MISLDKLASYLKNRINIQPINPRYVLSRFKLGNEDYRRSGEYTDPTNMPFYYYLGKVLQVENVLELGFESGIESGCFLTGCKTVKNFLAFHNNQAGGYWSPRLPRANILNILKKKFDYWSGNITDPEFLKRFLARKWDVVIIDRITVKDIARRYLELAWGQMPLGGIIVLDQIKHVSDAYNEFCTVVKRPLTVIKTRNETGLVMK